MYWFTFYSNTSEHKLIKNAYRVLEVVVCVRKLQLCVFIACRKLFYGFQGSQEASTWVNSASSRAKRRGQLGQFLYPLTPRCCCSSQAPKNLLWSPLTWEKIGGGGAARDEWQVIPSHLQSLWSHPILSWLLVEKLEHFLENYWTWTLLMGLIKRSINCVLSLNDGSSTQSWIGNKVGRCQ